jgi:hypothetical protein
MNQTEILTSMSIFRKENTSSGVSILLFSRLSRVPINCITLTPDQLSYSTVFSNLVEDTEIVLQTSNGFKIESKIPILIYLAILHGKYFIDQEIYKNMMKEID